MSDKLKVHWYIQPGDVTGNALGYNTHNRYMMRFTEPFIEKTHEAAIALHITSAEFFRPIPGKVNVLFTMWEFLDIPPSYVKSISLADALIVPSTFCRDLFRKYTEKPIYVCHEGVDKDLFKFHSRRAPQVSNGERFRFLWLGASNPRKGYPLVLEAIKVFEKYPHLEIYLKTTMPKLTWKDAFKKWWEHRKNIMYDGKKRIALSRIFRRLPKPVMSNKVTVMGKHKNIIFDTRKLSTDDLIKLYQSTHCFLFPTLGEGWGLPLSEAMATGCPSIATPVTGCSDFFDEQVGYGIKHSIIEQDLPNYNVRANAYIPDTRDFVKKMCDVIMDYPSALKKGKKASERILAKFTWDRAGKRLYDILKEISDSQGLKGGMRCQ